jgi:hypothetical protein
MDLALALGHPSVEAMLHTMTARELGQWGTYARRYFLPQQRIELALANLARLQGSGTLGDYVFDTRLRELITPKVVTADVTADGAAQAMSGMFGGAKIIRLGAVPMGQERMAGNG